MSSWPFIDHGAWATLIQNVEKWTEESRGNKEMSVVNGHLVIFIKTTHITTWENGKIGNDNEWKKKMMQTNLVAEASTHYVNQQLMFSLQNIFPFVWIVGGGATHQKKSKGNQSEVKREKNKCYK